MDKIWHVVLSESAAKIGVCYGMRGNNLPSPREVINMYKQYNIGRMRLYDPNLDALQALRGTNIELMLNIPNKELKRIASSQDYANTWFWNNVQNYGDVTFRYIAVGNEIKPHGPFAQYLFPAMQNIRTAVYKLALEKRFKSPLPLIKLPLQSPTLHQKAPSHLNTDHFLILSLAS